MRKIIKNHTSGVRVNKRVLEMLKEKGITLQMIVDDYLEEKVYPQFYGKSKKFYKQFIPVKDSEIDDFEEI
jgi:uncharacterized protein YdaT